VTNPKKGRPPREGSQIENIGSKSEGTDHTNSSVAPMLIIALANGSIMLMWGDLNNLH